MGKLKEMKNKNTARKSLYLPQELSDWFNEHIKSIDGIKSNTIFIKALTEYMERNKKEHNKIDQKFENGVLSVLKKHGVKTKTGLR